MELKSQGGVINKEETDIAYWKLQEKTD